MEFIYSRGGITIFLFLSEEGNLTLNTLGTSQMIFAALSNKRKTNKTEQTFLTSNYSPNRLSLRYVKNITFQRKGWELEWGREGETVKLSWNKDKQIKKKNTLSCPNIGDFIFIIIFKHSEFGELLDGEPHWLLLFLVYFLLFSWIAWNLTVVTRCKHKTTGLCLSFLVARVFEQK